MLYNLKKFINNKFMKTNHMLRLKNITKQFYNRTSLAE